MKIGFALLAFLISYNLYLYKMATVVCDMRIMKLWNYYSIGGLLCVVFFARALTALEKTIKVVAKICILTTILTILLTNHAIITNPYYLLFVFNGLIFVNTIIVLICMKRHGLIND